VDRIVNQVANPVRWDLCMATMSGLNVTAMLELVPVARWPAWPSVACLASELLALKTPDQLDAARALVAAHAVLARGSRA